jgi:putative endonuclease
MGRNQLLGAKGEDLVAEFLIAQGYQIIDRNWRIKEGEIDLIARNKHGEITFIEVKTRSNENYGHPLEAINKDKAHRLQKLALAWLVLNNCFGADYAIDCASVLILNGRTEIDYRKGVL